MNSKGGILGTSIPTIIAAAAIIIILILFGTAELILGIGVMKLKDYLGSFAQIIGILKIVNGAMFISIIFSPLSSFLLVPVLIMEIILIYNAAQKIGE